MIAFFYDSWTVILKFLIPGIFLGAVYDVFRLIRISRNDQTNSVKKAIRDRYFPNKKRNHKIKMAETVLVFIEDILFFIIVAVVHILATYHFNDGEIRIYSLMISALGFFVYQKTLGRLILFFSKKILYLIRKIIYMIVCMVLTPLFFLLRSFRKLTVSIRRKREIRKELLANTRKDI